MRRSIGVDCQNAESMLPLFLLLLPFSLYSFLLVNPSWIYSKERVTNDPLRKFSRFLLPRILFFRDCRLTRKEGIQSIQSFQDPERMRKGGTHRTFSFKTSLVATSSSFFHYPRATSRIHRGNKCWKHPGSRVSTSWTETREVLLISSA